MQKKNRKARDSEVATDLADWDEIVGCYEVVDIDKFFDVYELNEDEQEAVRERWEQDGLWVYHDGTVIWHSGDVLMDAMDEPLSEQAFRAEAAAAGSVVQ